MPTAAARPRRAHPDRAQLDRAQRAENFPVALRVLPATRRRDLLAVYDVARTIDELGDSAPGDRTAALHAFRDDLHRVFDDDHGHPQVPVLRALVPTARDRGLDRADFDALIEANLMDQATTRYATYDDLRAYCALSADPIGRLVLAIFDADTPRRRELSNAVCTALQVLEHLQDVGEDRRAGRVYLPQDAMAHHGVSEEHLDAPTASPGLRALVAGECARVGAGLDAAGPLLGELRGWARVAVAGFVAGGRAGVDALRRAGYDVLAGDTRTRRPDVVRHVARELARAVRR